MLIGFYYFVLRCWRFPRRGFAPPRNDILGGAVQLRDKMKFAFLLCSNEPGGANGVSTPAGQTGTCWPSALADKLKFDTLLPFPDSCGKIRKYD